MSGATTTIKAHVKTVDMSEEMEKFAIDTATEALMTCMKEKDMATKVCPLLIAWPCCSTSVPGVRHADAPRHPVLYHPAPFAPLQIKSEFDKTYNPTWHVIVGSNYGSHVVHSTKCQLWSQKWQRSRPGSPRSARSHSSGRRRCRRLAVHGAFPGASSASAGPAADMSMSLPSHLIAVLALTQAFHLLLLGSEGLFDLQVGLSALVATLVYVWGRLAKEINHTARNKGHS